MAADRLIVSNTDRRGWEFLHARSGLYWQDSFQSICREIDGQIVGAFGYTDYTGTSVQMHVAGATDTWLNRKLLWQAFAYPFLQLDCKVAIGVIAEGNDPARQLAKKLGFGQFAIIPDAHPDGGLVITVMKRGDCRWLELSQRRFHG